MRKPRPDNDQSVLSDSAVVRIADEVERRILRVLQPNPASTSPVASPRQIDLNDLLTPQQAAHFYGKSDQTIYRWIIQFDISECIAGIPLVSRRKIEAHLARRAGRGGSR